MVFSPERINIIGEHTDYNNGFVFPSAVNKGKDKLSPENYQKALFVIQENARAVEASKVLIIDDLQILGELIYASHMGLQHQYKLSCAELDYLVEKKSQIQIF
ncbi:galactokinase family protein [Formosa sp. 4Alg 33]|uniref:galactokinase family protein n=1 Tax=Formosa sp. 4Alg 33 TaxID=3382189 RepID=UPI003D9C532F